MMLKSCCEAICIEHSISNLKTQNSVGRIAGIYRNCFNIVMDSGSLVTVFAMGSHMSPAAIRTSLDSETDFRQMESRTGDKVLFSDGVMMIPAEGFFCKLRSADIKEIRRTYTGQVQTNKQKAKNIAVLENEVVMKGKLNGAAALMGLWSTWLKSVFADETAWSLISKMNEKVLRIWIDMEYNSPKELPHVLGKSFFSSLALLLISIRQGYIGLAKECLDDLVGRGIGLTPSADDVLCGLAAWVTMANQNTEKDYAGLYLNTLKEYIKHNAQKRTTIISASYLGHAANRIFSDELYNLINAIHNSSREKNIRAAASGVMNFGSSSGSETCLGILSGAYAFSDVPNIKEFIN